MLCSCFPLAIKVATFKGMCYTHSHKKFRKGYHEPRKLKHITSVIEVKKKPMEEIIFILNYCKNSSGELAAKKTSSRLNLGVSIHLNILELLPIPPGTLLLLAAHLWSSFPLLRFPCFLLGEAFPDRGSSTWKVRRASPWSPVTFLGDVFCILTQLPLGRLFPPPSS